MKQTLLLFGSLIFLFINKHLEAQFYHNKMLDTTFGSGGKVITPLNKNKYQGCTVRKVLVQSDRKFIVAGNAPDVHWNNQIMLVRYFVDGSIDSSFGVNGFVFSMLTNREIFIRDAALQSDGKIVVAAEYQQYISSSGAFIDTFALLRFNHNGLPDETFAKKGLVNLTTPSYALAIDKENNIFVGGQQKNHDDVSALFSVQKFSANGKQDSSFGKQGTAKIHFGKIETYGLYPVITIDKNNNIVLVSTATTDKDPHNNNFVVIRFKATGFIDSSFNKKGWNAVNYNAVQNVTNSIALQGNNIIVGGMEGSTSNNFLIARFKANGMLDSSFGNAGFVTTDFSGDDINPHDDYINTMLVQKNNKIVAAGVTVEYTNNYGRFALSRYNANGSVDNSFGKNGKIVTMFGLKDSRCGAGALQADDKILAAGFYQGNGSGNVAGNVAIARYLNQKETDAVAEQIVSNIQQQLLELSPNPVHNLLSITGLSISNDYHLNIFNESGISVLSKEINNSAIYNLNVVGLHNGIYYAAIISSSGKPVLIKFAKE